MLKFLPFIWQNLVRNRLRTTLTAAAIALAVALVCLLLTMPAGLDAIMSSLSSNTRIVVLNKGGLVYSMPYAYMNKIRARPGVVAATSWTWFGGAVDVDRGVTFPNFAVEPDAIGSVWEDWRIADEHLDAFRRRRDGAIVGQSTLQQNGWKVGDRVALSSTIFPTVLEFEIVGEIPNERAPHFWFQREYLDQALRARTGSGLDFMGTVWVRVDDASRVQPLIAEIDDMFRNSEAETTSETELAYMKNFMGQLDGFVTIILIVTGLVTLCLVFIAANTASMSVRERVAEIAVLKAVGFRKRLVFTTLLVEAVLLSMVGGGAGLLIAFGLTKLLQTIGGAGWSPALGPLGSFIITPAIFVQGLFLALFVGMLSGWVPAFGASRRGVAAAMREVF
jgi:putative ABC transport system permease protein